MLFIFDLNGYMFLAIPEDPLQYKLINVGSEFLIDIHTEKNNFVVLRGKEPSSRKIFINKK
jgi:hypothetical protein